MRIGIVSTWLERGAAYVSRQYQSLLHQHGHEVFIYARGGERYAIGDPHWDTPEVTWGKEPTVKAVNAIHKKDFIRWIHHCKLDAVIFNEQWWLPPILWAREAGCKAIAYVDYYTEATVPLFAVYDGLICNTKRHLSVFDWHPQCLYLPWGTDISIFHPRADIAPAKCGPVFFHSAGMSPVRKGTDLVLQAFAQLSGKASLVLHLQGVAFESIPEVRNLAERLIRQGRLQVYDEEVSAPGLYHLGDVYVYPSRLEGIGLTQAEALASGLPLIVPDNPPMNEFITPQSGVAVSVEKLWSRADGYYWPQCQVSLDALSKAMQLFVDDCGTLESRKQSARRYAEHHLDWLKNGKPLEKWLTALPQNELSEGLTVAIAKEETEAPAVRFWRLKQFPALWGLLKKTQALTARLR